MPELTLWDTRQTKPLAEPDSPGLMGFLRSQVSLPEPAPNFGRPAYNAEYNLMVHDVQTGYNYYVSSHDEATRYIARQVYRGYDETRYRILTHTVWGLNRYPREWRISLTAGPYNGAWAREDQDGNTGRVMTFTSYADALYWSQNYIDRAHMPEIIQTT